MAVQRAILIELFAILFVLVVEFMPQEWTGALGVGLLIGVVALVYGFVGDREFPPPKSE